MSGNVQRIYMSFAELIDYPGADLADQARECVGQLKQDHPEAAEQLERFLEFAESTPLGRLEEIYTGTFDLNPACFIFAGYLLFGESFKRGKFLVGLQQRYKERGFSVGPELADHLSVMFRFLATLEVEDVLAQELLEDCLLPVLQRMNANFKHDNENPNPYAGVLKVILNVLERTQQRIPVVGAYGGTPCSTPPLREEIL